MPDYIVQNVVTKCKNKTNIIYFMKKITIDSMNQEIAKWLYDDAKIRWKEVRGKEVWEIFKQHEGYVEYLCDMNDCKFNDNGNHLMKVLAKIMLKGFWYAVYPIKISKWTGKGSSKKLHTEMFYQCAFTKDGMGRMGYGEKLNGFLKKTPELAIQYSIYRFITKGIEY